MEELERRRRVDVDAIREGIKRQEEEKEQRAADADALKTAHRAASRACHPDRGGSTEQQQAVEEAYRALLQAAHDERWGTSASAIGAHVAAPTKRLTNA